MNDDNQRLFCRSALLRAAEELSDEERYDYTVRQIARSRAAWLLADGDAGGISMELGGKECICIWPEADFAADFAQDDVLKPKRIDLDDLLDVLEEMTSDEGTAFAVFPTRRDVYVASTGSFYEDLCELAEAEENSAGLRFNPHIWSAPAEKRYESFLHTVCDRAAVWMIRKGDEPLTIAQCLPLWPARQDVAEYLHRQGLTECEPALMDLLLFLRLLEAAADACPSLEYQVFPTEQNGCSVRGEKLLEDLSEELESY